MYNYKAKIVKVVDGDTVIADIDLGFYITLQKQRFRLIGIDAYPLKEQKGIEAKNYLEKIILNKEVVFEVKKSKDKYGRWLVTIYFEDKNINNLLIENNLAVQLKN